MLLVRDGATINPPRLRRPQVLNDFEDNGTTCDFVDRDGISGFPGKMQGGEVERVTIPGNFQGVAIKAFRVSLKDLCC